MSTLVPDILLFLLLAGGGGLWFASLWRGVRPAEALCIGLGCVYLAVFLAGFAVHVTSAPRELWFALPALAVLGLWTRRRRIAPLLRDEELRRVSGAWAVFAIWSLGLLGLVVVYSGGFWSGDWLEHYQRAVFFLQGGSSDQLFLKGIYTLSARPPLANVVTAVFMRLGGGGFADCQVFMTLLGTSLLFPAWLLASRWSPPGRPSTPFLIGALLMLNPMVMQNLTFNWTKSLTAFWILSGVYFLLRGRLDRDWLSARLLAFAALAAGMLTHYSTGPWILVCVGVFLLLSRAHWLTTAFWRETATHAAVAILILAPWLVWITAQRGFSGAFTENTTAQSAAGRSLAETAGTALLNIRDTLIPVGLRATNTDVLNQASTLGRLRDDLFNAYQLSLPLALGFGGLLAAGLLLCSPVSPIRRAPRRALGWFAAAATLTALGVAVVTQRDDWGLAHISLQPLVIIALAWLASRLPESPLSVRIAWAAGAGADFFLGIFLHYGMQSLWLEPLHRQSPVAFILNYLDQKNHKIVTFGEHLQSSQLPLLLLLAALLAISLLLAFRTRHAHTAAS